MTPLMGLLVIVIAGLAIFALALWVERATQIAGLAFIFTAVGLLGAAALGAANGRRLLPIVFVLQAIGFLVQARWRRTKARAERAAATEE